MDRELLFKTHHHRKSSQLRSSFFGSTRSIASSVRIRREKVLSFIFFMVSSRSLLRGHDRPFKKSTHSSDTIDLLPYHSLHYRLSPYLHLRPISILCHNGYSSSYHLSCLLKIILYTPPKGLSTSTDIFDVFW